MANEVKEKRNLNREGRTKGEWKGCCYYQERNKQFWKEINKACNKRKVLKGVGTLDGNEVQED